MQFVLEAACLCSAGRVRNNNEDNIYFNRHILDEDNIGLSAPLFMRSAVDAVCFAVFDGMGGEADGQIAAHLAARIFQRDCDLGNLGGMLSESFFVSAIAHMNDYVCLQAEQNHTHMGTTAVILGFCDESVYVCNVGDSKAFRFRDQKLTQISMDHIEEVPPLLMGSKRKKPRLNQCIGISPKELQIEPYIARGIIQNNDRFLICSDGLTDMVTLSEITEILSSDQDVVDCAQHLVDTALSNGGRDNVTVIIARVTATSEGDGKNV